MDRDYLIKLTLALYKVTELLPEEEPLKVAMRRESLAVLCAGVQEIDGPLASQIGQAIKNLQALSEIASEQNWLDRINFTILSDSYNNVREALPDERPEMPAKTINQPDAPAQRPGNRLAIKTNPEGLKKPRHRQIIQFLEKRKSAQVKDFKEIFSNISKRTLRRDMDFLLKEGLIKRIGDKNSTEYQIKRPALVKAMFVR